MRVIAGQWRGRPLAAPRGEATRPTSDRARETLFSMLTSRLGAFAGLRVGDFFAGSGALGIEALSRGAGSCLFVEHDAEAVKALKTNLATLGAHGEIRASSVMALPPAREPLDLLLFDPPYRTGAGAVAIERLARLGWIGPASWLSLETAAKEDAGVRGFDVVAERRVGAARLTLLRMPAADAPPG